MKIEKAKGLEKYKVFLVSTMAWGILAHGTGLFRKINFLDDMVCTFGVGHTHILGRWMLGFVAWITDKIFGGHYSLPIFNGMISILMVAVAGCLLIDLFEIRKTGSMIALSGIMVMFPTLTSLFCGYMFTAPYYLFAVALCVAGAYMICRYKHLWYGLVGGCLLITLALGIYQAYLPLALGIMVIYMLKAISEDENDDWKEYFKKASLYIIACVFILILYLVITKVSLWFLNMELDGYKDADNFNMTDVRGYIWRIKLAYMEFFMPTSNPDFIKYNMYRGFLGILYKGMLIFDFALCIYWLVTQKSSFRKKIQCGILLLILPLAINFIFVMINRWYIYSLMMYAQIMVFCFTLWLTEKVTVKGNPKINHWKNYAGIGIVLAACILYWHYDNTCYLKADMMQAEMDSWLTTLVTQIKSTEGYDSSKAVVFVNASNKSDENWPVIPEFDEIDIEPYVWEAVINDNSWINYMKYRCGYEPDILDPEAYEEREEVISMPSYPASGSIQIIDDVIVVKF